MIAFTKPTAPAVLLGRGTTAVQQLCTAFTATPHEYRRGTRTFDFDRSIYAADEVKAALRAAQHDKCAFCESAVAHVSHGDIEHFRPKAGYRQRERDPLRRPGYYWLAYDWDNLFYCCSICNQRFKRNHFPLHNGRHRARSHADPLARERPLLIDPTAQNPSAYLGFREERVYAVRGCREGRATIKVLGLNRPELTEVRRDRLDLLRELVESRDALLRLAATTPTPRVLDRLRSVRDVLRRSREPASPYAAMARAFLDAHPEPAT